MSELIEWSDAMVCGVDAMDRQHRVLVDTLAEASAKLAGRAGDPLFERITQDLLAYAIYHFETEEKLMQQYAYAAKQPDEAGKHIAAHRGFTRQVVAMRDETRTGGPAAEAELLRFLKDWLVDHIMSVDQQFARFVIAARASDEGSTPAAPATPT